jgi:hypothetical protein
VPPRPRSYKLFSVLLDLRWKPVGARLCSDEAEDRRGLQGSHRAGLAILDLDLPQVIVTAHRADRGVQKHRDVRRLLDASSEVGRHAGIEVAAANDKVAPRSIPRWLRASS